MTRTITGQQVGGQLRELARAAHRGEPIVIEADGERLAALVDIGTYELWEARRADILGVLEARPAPQTEMDEDELEAFILEEIHQMRAERRGS